MDNFTQSQLGRFPMDEIKGDSTIEVITPEIAQNYLKKNRINRVPLQRVIDCYAEDMAAGRWQLNGASIKFDIEGCLIDGQHRLLACIKSRATFITYVTRGLPLDAMDTIDNGKARSAGDVFRIKQIPNGSTVSSIVRRYMSLKKHLVVMTAAGSGKTPKTSNVQILEVYYDNETVFKDAVMLSGRCYDACSAFVRSDIGGFYSYLVMDCKHQKENVVDFFEQLCDMKPTEYQMLRICRRLFVNDKASTVHMIGSVKQALVIKAWNYFVCKKDVSRFSYNNQTDKDIWFH